MPGENRLTLQRHVIGTYHTSITCTPVSQQRVTMRTSREYKAHRQPLGNLGHPTDFGMGGNRQKALDTPPIGYNNSNVPNTRISRDYGLVVEIPVLTGVHLSEKGLPLVVWESYALCGKNACDED